MECYCSLGMRIKKEKYCYLIKTKDNYIKKIKDLKEFKDNIEELILFRIRNSLKNNNYEVINPIFESKKFTSDINNFLNDKIWFSVKSLNYYGGNNLNYNLNTNDIIKIGKKKYNIIKIHFAFEDRNGDVKDDNFYEDNNISYISALNKKSKSIFNIEIETNRYIITNNKNKNFNNEILNEVNNQIYKNNNQNIYQNNNGIYIDIKNNIINSKNIKNNEDNNTTNSASTQNNFKYGNNNYQSNTHKLSTNYYTGNEQNDNNNSDSESDGENDMNKCWLCLSSNTDIDNPLVCLCNCHNYIHFECLKMNLNSRIRITENLKRTVKTYTCEKFNCDMCLKPYRAGYPCYGYRHSIPEASTHQGCRRCCSTRIGSKAIYRLSPASQKRLDLQN